MFLSSASTIDLTLTQELFLNLAKAAELLGEPKKSKQYLSIANQIHPPVIAPNGRMQEWVENHEEFEPGHRHRSPFVGLCPGGLFSGNGWRPGNGGLAWFPGLKQIQVDGQLGMISAISEWFYQDMQGIIRLLPALPDAVASSGSLCGIQGRYGFGGDLFWENGQLKQFRLYSKLGKTCKIRYCGPKGGRLKISHYGTEIVYTTDDLGICTFDTQVNEHYLITYES